MVSEQPARERAPWNAGQAEPDFLEGHPAEPEQVEPEAAPASASEPAPGPPVVQSPEGALPKRVRQPSAIQSARAGSTPQPAQRSATPEPASQAATPEPTPPPAQQPLALPADTRSPANSSNWESPGDEGWRAAQALLNNPTPESTTTAGLPKRVPKAQLIPGSAGPRQPQQEQQEQRPPVSHRSAEVVRGRMSSLQHGVRRGRHALVESHAGERSSAEKSSPFESRQDEEQA